jgi:hypothetical protein
MLSPIPARILKDTASFFVPESFDRYQNPTGETYTVERVHLQPENHTRKTTDNTEVTLTAVMFVYARRSAPALDFWALQTSAQEAGGQMTVTVASRSGAVTGPYTVAMVDRLPDDEGNLHHWELGLV